MLLKAIWSGEDSNMAANRTAGKERVWLSKGARGVSLDVCGVCGREWGTVRPQESYGLAAWALWDREPLLPEWTLPGGAVLAQNPCHLVEGSNKGQKCSHTNIQMDLGHHPGLCRELLIAITHVEPPPFPSSEQQCTTPQVLDIFSECSQRDLPSCASLPESTLSMLQASKFWVQARGISCLPDPWSQYRAADQCVLCPEHRHSFRVGTGLERTLAQVRAAGAIWYAQWQVTGSRYMCTPRGP